MKWQHVRRSVSKPAILWSCLAIVAWLLFVVAALSTSSPSWLPDVVWSILALPADDGVLEARGQFGDSFGPFNALVSSLALVGVISTLALQQTVAKQQQFQEQLFHAVAAYQSLLESFETNYRTKSGEPGSLRGRSALQNAWQHYVVGPFLRNCKAPGMDDVARNVGSLFFGETVGFAATQGAIESVDRQVAGWLSTDGATAALEVLGQAWWALYSSHRHHLDALFRAWYTVHRILNEAPNYSVTVDAQRLYAASFRAQISWIEMVYMLANQSALPHNAMFPRACRYANYFCAYDNLATTGDVTVTLLVEVAKARKANPSGNELTRAAFSR